MKKLTFYKGFSLLELMIAIAIISIISAIAIPAYTGFIKEAQFGTAKANADSIRIFLEDYHLDNATYIVGGDTSYNEAELDTNFGWVPDGDNGAYTYAVDVTTNSWDISVTHTGSGNWIRYEDRGQTYCDTDTAGASVTACP